MLSSQVVKLSTIDLSRIVKRLVLVTTISV